MRYLLQLCVLFTLLAPSAVFGADQIRLAQSFQTAPAVPPPQLLPQTTIAGTCKSPAIPGDELPEYLCGPLSQHAGQPAVQPDLHHAQLVCKQRRRA